MSPTKTAVIHLSLNPCGGSEKLALTICSVLKDAGHTVDLIVVEKTQWFKINRILGFNKNVIDYEVVVPPYTHLPTLGARFIYWFFRDVLAFSFLRAKYDLSIVTMPTLPLVQANLLYIHFPDFAPDGFDLCYSHRYSGILRPYFLLFRNFNSIAISIFKKTKRKPITLTNSKFSAAFINRYLGLKAIVLHPAVDVEKYSCITKHRQRRNIVLTISRIEPSKRLDIIPEIAHCLADFDVNFVIIGASNYESVDYSNLILDKAKKFGVEKKIRIITNASEEEKSTMLSEAKLYLHTMKCEHFGISIVEAMSAGLIPIVHTSGGPWVDILDTKQGVIGYGYADAKEAAETIKMLLNDDFTVHKVVEQTVAASKKYSLDAFSKKLNNIIELS